VQSDLKFKRVKDVPTIHRIPAELIENIKGRTYEVEKFYKYQEIQLNNQYNLLFTLENDQNKVVGFLWAVIGMLDDSLFINHYSILKEYWNKGVAINLAISFIALIKNKGGYSSVLWNTTNSKFFKKHGFTESKIRLMEYPYDEYPKEKLKN
jgi:N-acetylglutamate synthase-like GNAT family acetyltransferase